MARPVVPTCSPPDVDLQPVRHVLHAIATTIVPETSSLDSRAWSEVEMVVAGALSKRSPRLQRQFIVFLRLLQSLPLARHGRTFTGLSERQRAAFLGSVERSRLPLVRRGFWGVRALIFLGYYTRDAVVEAIGYRASASGWAARGGTVSTVPLAPVLWVEP